MTPLEILKGARELLAQPENWTKNMWARNANNQFCEIEAPEACKWCSAGAMRKVSGVKNKSYSAEETFVKALDAMHAANGQNIVSMNDEDETTHQDIVEAFDKGIAYLEKKDDHS